MRRFLIVFLIFFPLLLVAQSKEYFYYYRGQKQYLELNTDYVFILTSEPDMLMNHDIVKRDNVKLQEVMSYNNVEGKKKSSDLYWAEIPIDIQRKSYNEQLQQLRNINGVELVTPYFKSKSSKKIGLSNFFYVKLKTLADTTLLRKYSNEQNATVVKQNKFMPLWFTLSCTRNTSRNALEMANIYYESKQFKCAEPDLMVDDILACVNDPFFPNQWGLRNIGQYNGTTGIDIKTCDAWRLSTGRNVTVAVIDQGIELNHRDLQANIHPLSYDTENGTSPSILRGNHGTACAGIVGALRNNNIGIAGAAPDCRLMSISSTLTLGPELRQRLANGINWAVQNNADILSNSWASNDLSSALIDDAITNALINGRNGLGCIVVFCSHNDNSSIRYPANSNPNILTVGAISPCGQRKSPSSCDGEGWGSNYGSQLDVVAPGVLIPTTDRQGNLGYNPNFPIHTQNGGNKITSDYTNRDYTVWFNGVLPLRPLTLPA